MKHFFIVTNQQKDEELALTGRVQDYILSRGGACEYGTIQKHETDGFKSLNPEELPEGCECVICIGGDGTLIRTAHEFLKEHVPIIGVNRGHIGYLCELDSQTVFGAIDALMKDEYMVEERMMLHGYCIRGGEKQPPHRALNDFVIHRSGLGQVVNLTISVNGEYLNTYSADGMIVATPTGSTAYSMSAGGPIVDPKAELFVMTPISPHSLNSRSIVLGAEDEITIGIGSRRMEQDEQVEVSFDGESAMQLAVGDQVVIRRSAVSTRFVKLSNRSFLEILRKKMQAP